MSDQKDKLIEKRNAIEKGHQTVLHSGGEQDELSEKDLDQTSGASIEIFLKRIP